VSDHQHESCDVYGLDGIRQDAREARSLAAGLREDLGRAQERIRDLEEQVAALRRSTPEARQAEYEADVAAADLAESGYGDPWCPAMVIGPAAMGLSLQHVNVGAIIAIAFLVLLFRAMVSK
jgi:hypothetical protein